MPTIGSIEPYDGVENFKQYMQRVNFYFTANNVGSEFASTDVTKRDLALAQRKAVLLTVIGKKTFHILTNLLDPKTTEEVTYTDISVSVSVVLAVTLLKEHLYSVRLVTLILIGVSTYTQIDQT